MKRPHLLILPLLAASTAVMAAPVTKKTVLNTEAGVINQLGNIQVLIGVLSYVNDTFRSNQGSDGNCDPDQDGKIDGKVSTTSLSRSIGSSLVSPDTFTVSRRTWDKCGLIKQKNQISELEYIRTGVRDDLKSQTVTDGKLSLIQLGASAKAPLVNTMNVTSYYGKKKVKATSTFNTFYRLEKLDRPTGSDTEHWAYEGAMIFAKTLTISSSIGDTKGSKTSPNGSPFVVTRDANGRITHIDGLFGIDIKAPAAVKKQLSSTCPTITGAARVETLEALTSSGQGGFGTYFNGLGEFTGGKLRFSDGKTDCNDAKKAKSCATITFKNNGKMDVQPAGKNLIAGVDQSDRFSESLCSAAFALYGVAQLAITDSR